MTTVLDMYNPAVINKRTAVIIVRGNHCKRAERVQPGYCRRGFLETNYFRSRLSANPVEKLVFKLNNAVLSRQNPHFKLF